ncbi:DUF2849 domain-containing protein [Jiella sp. MQZ9-1]|uniref:DUF2849 domain-containing protein n=1 Tax=Jiella flava TaxID=2816857 RepID=A0A939JVI8_9HYPH|nr:DUF2849 domain-containing protein [Jiella flava]MBO0661326.1 DUF2849 domain-containing protein [Jiella flava]MCD2469971.1 DUF2849 domain-containing protein [Jiella flava]
MAKDHRAGSKVRGDKLPAILMASHLLEGDTVFLTDGDWTRDPSAAKIAHDAETAEAMEVEGKAAAAANLVIDPYLVPVELTDAGLPVARHFRDAMRQKGPSVHKDMGKQAEFQPLG